MRVHVAHESNCMFFPLLFPVECCNIICMYICILHIGQSFGAFICRGITLELEGDANDYVGKVGLGLDKEIEQFIHQHFTTNGWLNVYFE